MKFNFFNRKIEINIAKVNKIKKTDTKFYKRYIYLCAIFLISIFINTLIENSQKYRLNMVVNHDIISNKNISYNVDLTTPSIIEEIKKSTSAEYDVNKSVSEENISKLNVLLNKINLLNENNIKSFIEENNLNISEKDLKNILEKRNYSYFRKLTQVLVLIYEKGVTSNQDIDELLNNQNLTNSEKALLKNYIYPNLTFNEEKTEKRIQSNLDRLKNNQKTIKVGDIIVKKGDKITYSSLQDLKKLGLVNTFNSNVKIITMLLIAIITSVIFYRTSKRSFVEVINSKGFIPSLITLAISNSIFLVFNYYTSFEIYLTPIFLIPILIFILTKNRLFTFMITILNYIFLISDYRFLLIVIVLTLYLSFSLDNIRSRQQIILANIEVLIFEIIFLIPYTIYVYNNINKILPNIFLAVISSLLSIILILGLLPIFENMFRVLTDIRLLELADFSNSLLKRLLVIAPGTFHHSIMVGALAEHAAEAVGCNHLFVRVASYYHDIGKMKRPQYFIENQFNHVNPHDKITPALSASIIINHVSDGVIIAEQNNLPEEIVQIIKTHHGKSFVNYFYYKALEQNENVDISEFEYKGPKPHTKEETIIMLADSIEAAVRVQKNKSYEAIKELVTYLINNKIEEGQLSDSLLTQKDIQTIINAFMEVLQGAYHERIEYPSVQKENKNA